MLLDTFIAIVGGIGVGSIISTYMINKIKIFDTKLLAYSTLIETLQNCISDKSEQAQQKYVSAQCIVSILDKKGEINRLAEKFYTPENESFFEMRKQLIKAMRDDLKI